MEPLPEDSAALFDRLLESSLRRANTTASPSSPRAIPIRLRPEARPVWMPTLARELREVDPMLRDTFRRLVAGLADWPILIHGPAGTGKTCAALSLLDGLLPREGQYTTAAELTARMIETYGTGERFDWSPYGRFRINEGRDPSHKWYCSGSVLTVLDELGARERVNDTHYEVVQRLIDRRRGLPLILISNLDLNGLAQVYDDRIASRAAEGTVFHLAGDDRRITKGGAL